MNTIPRLAVWLLTLLATSVLNAQQADPNAYVPLHKKSDWTVANAHSHNDYQHKKKSFTAAYAAGFGSIEVDIFLSHDSLFVGHEPEDIQLHRMLRPLYLDPLAANIRRHGGHPYEDTSRRLQLLVDIKTDSIATLDALLQHLRSYPDIIRCRGLSIVITGNRPPVDAWPNYPSFIYFDGSIGQTYPPTLLPKIAMISGDLEDFIKWDGKSTLSSQQAGTLSAIIEGIHRQGKKVRFWDAPDFKNSWLQLIGAGVDWINTDHIERLAGFLGN